MTASEAAFIVERIVLLLVTKLMKLDEAQGGNKGIPFILNLLSKHLLILSNGGKRSVRQ